MAIKKAVKRKATKKAAPKKRKVAKKAAPKRNATKKAAPKRKAVKKAKPAAKAKKRVVKKAAPKRKVVEKNSGKKYGPEAGNEVEKEMRRFKKGTAKSGKAELPVESREQAIAIGLSKARKKGAKVPKKP